MTIPAQPEPSDATRFATRPKQRRKELVNATDNTLTKLREEARAEVMDALAAPTVQDLQFGQLRLDERGQPAVAHGLLVSGIWRQYRKDDRTLDPETVAEQFARAEREYSAAIHNRAVIRQYGVAP
jgi:hypothetical protein